MIGRKVIGLKEVFLLMIAKLPKYLCLGSDFMKSLKFLYVIPIILFISIIFTSSNVYAAVSQNSFLSNEKITASDIFSGEFSSNFKKTYLKTEFHNNYSHIQSFCTDGTYFYVACLTDRNENSTDIEQRYTDQETTILKIKMKNKKIIASAYLGKIGHSNSLAYNNLNNTILIAPCNKMR